MGRDYNGHLLHYQCKRIELSYLLKSGIIQQGRTLQTTLNWNDKSSITIKSKYDDYEKYLQLEYTHTDYEQKKQNLSYRISLITLPSNLGRGNVIFMICPISGSLCRKLYMAYGSQYFKSIKAYNTRIYYTGQLSSKQSRANDRYWHCQNKIEKSFKIRSQSHYKGKETKRSIKKENQFRLLIELDLKRWNDIPSRLKNVLSTYN